MRATLGVEVGDIGRKHAQSKGARHDGGGGFSRLLFLVTATQ